MGERPGWKLRRRLRTRSPKSRDMALPCEGPRCLKALFFLSPTACAVQPRDHGERGIQRARPPHLGVFAVCEVVGNPLQARLHVQAGSRCTELRVKS